MQQTVLITGSSSGLGNSLSRYLLEKGFRVFATMRAIKGKNAQAASALREFADANGYALELLELDVSDAESVRLTVAALMSKAGQIDILINNAGIGGVGYTEAFSTEQFIQTFEVNVFGIQRMMREVLPLMRQAGSGLVINVSSTMGRLVIPFAAAYTASKYALEALAESYHYELSPLGIDVSIVEPGGFASNYWDNTMQPQDKQLGQGYGEADSASILWTGIRKLVTSEAAPDASVVADAVMSLIEMPAGTRPLRLIVDPLMGGGGADVVNATSSQVQAQILATLGLSNLLQSN
jgi:NAD(P)-dependent dehydrogenase (short-subunit alcohol dehydrogenase family)